MGLPISPRLGKGSPFFAANSILLRKRGQAATDRGKDMYRIIGADGKEYGPITAEQLGHWIAEGRANGQTRVRPEASPEWRLLSELPEFAEVLGARPRIQAAAAPQFAAGATPEAMADEILARGFQLDVMSCISRSWGLLMRNFWLLVGATLVEILIASAVPILQSVCMGGIFFLCLRLIRGERAEFGDGFAGFSIAFLQLFLGGLVQLLLISVGLFLCILPGIYLGVAWVFSIPLMVDRRFDFWPAMELSRKVVHRHWWTVFGLLLALWVVLFLGACVCGVGYFVAAPVALGAIAFAYEDIFGTQPGASRPGAAASNF